MKHSLRVALLALALSSLGLAARADALDALNGFLKDVRSGRASFTQTVTAPDGKRKKSSTGSFEFQRPNQFRFSYEKPFEQLIVGDGQKVWIFDPELMQASSRKLGEALGSTPVALLAGGNLSKDFQLKALPAEAGLEWVQATPRQSENQIQQLRIGFRGKELAAIEILDGFGQRTQMLFSAAQFNTPLSADRFRFELPKGADLIEQ